MTADAPGPRPQLAELYHRHKDAVLTLAHHLLDDRQAAEDVLHDVFVAIARNGLDPAALSSPRGYVLRAAIHRARDVLRSGRHRAVVSDLEPDALAGSLPPPDARLSHAEWTHRVAATLARLPLDQREVVVLHGCHDLSFRAVAELLGVPIHTAASRWRYAVARLRSAPLAQGIRR